MATLAHVYAALVNAEPATDWVLAVRHGIIASRCAHKNIMLSSSMRHNAHIKDGAEQLCPGCVLPPLVTQVLWMVKRGRNGSLA